MSDKIDLHTCLTHLIAERDGIDLNEVTVAYIHEQREKIIYSDTRYDAPLGLISLTRNEWERVERNVDSLLELI